MRFLRLGYMLVGVLVLTWALASPASAVLGFGDCKEAPAPAAPGSGISGWFSTPEHPPADPAGGAWADGAPVFANYGTAGMTFHTYDLGCGPDVSRDPGAVIETTIANWGMEVVKFGVEAADALLHAAYHPTYLSVFDPLLVHATAALRDAVFTKWAPVSIAVVGVIILWRSRAANWAHMAASVGWALLVLVVAFSIFQWPVRAGSVADETVGNLLGGINAGINGTSTKADPVDSAMNTLTNAVLFEEWKMGEFGRTNSTTADKYAKALYTAQALTWQEYATVQADPQGKGKALLEAKAKQWDDTAAAIKDDDPAAYDYLTGHRSGGRFAAVGVAMIALVCVVPFLLVGAFMMVAAYLLVRMAVVFFPVIATVGIIYALRGAVKGVGMVIGAALLNSVIFGTGLAVDLLLVRTLLAPASGLPVWLALFLMLAVSVIMWFALKPFRRLTAMASPSSMFADGAGSFGSMASSAKSVVYDVAKTAAAAYTGGAVAAAAINEHTDETAAAAAKAATPRAEGYSTTDTPTPTTAAPMALDAAPDREPAPAVAPPPISNPPAPLPPGETTPVREDTTPTFVPGADPQVPDVQMPRVAEPSLDPESGDEVYQVFRPDDDEVASE